MAFLPKADGIILRPASVVLPSSRPKVVGPIFDRDNFDKPIKAWSSDDEKAFSSEFNAFSEHSVPEKPADFSERYLRAHLSEHERLRLSVMWYYARDILQEDEFLAGLQEKAQLAQESTDWEYAVIGILDVDVYIRLATVGLELGILPRGETICAHTVTQPPGNVFLLPSLMEDWRFRRCPYLEDGELHAYAGVPLRFKTESGPTVSLGSLCVASGQSREPLTKAQHQTLVRLGDWVVSDLVQWTRARRQRDRLRMSALLNSAQNRIDMNKTVSVEPIMEILRQVYPDTTVFLQPSRVTHVELDGLDPIPIEELEKGPWENVEYLEDFIANRNHLPTPADRPARIMSAPCDAISGPSLLVVVTNDFHFVFDDADACFIQACADALTQMWRKSLLAEAMIAKEKFLRAFSHQLRTPVHGILGSVELLSEELKSRSLTGVDLPASSPKFDAASEKPAGEPSTYLDIIKMAGRDLISIIDNLIMLNKWSDIAMTERQYQVHTLDDLETQVAEHITQSISGDSRYTCSVFLDQKPQVGHEVTFSTDMTVLRDTLLPLIVNSLQHAPRGLVSITTSISIETKQLIVDIEDTGEGIPACDQERIFEAYEKVDPHSAGAGLGLTLASKFASLIHGTIQLVSSNLGQGSHFRATFDQIDCCFSDSPSRPIAQKLDDMPLRFFQLHCESDLRLGDRFASFLSRNGYSRSQSPEDCLIVFEAGYTMDQHHEKLAQIGHDQVAICLVPEKQIFQQKENNVIYIHGPFRTSTFHSSLQKAHEYRRLRVAQSNVKSKDQLKEPKHIALKDTEEVDARWELASSNAILNEVSQDVQEIASSPPHTSNLNATCLLSASPPPPRTSSRPLTLIVDDNFVNLRVMESYCSKRKLPYLSAMNGLQAVEIFTKHQTQHQEDGDPQIEMIFMDLQMPVCGGVEATQQIRELESSNDWSKSLVFVMTGQDSPSDRKATELVGVNEYFVKPVVVKQLDRVVKTYFPSFMES
ncbi:hypothetical protein N7539_004208 [Penicillium diatomitis]|uniref:histidine kinase n=1 Tax=Penicillium diatomitis TaxID=2819901 RepID=A0A9W9XE13_9EURO|nr:uncharacterized protein N7539_004208 [Penicillium diatomitis]KAJ5489318.1 hypothetical protein N7539_004208 [Penicillium diatomitis]